MDDLEYIQEMYTEYLNKTGRQPMWLAMSWSRWWRLHDLPRSDLRGMFDECIGKFQGKILVGINPFMDDEIVVFH